MAVQGGCALLAGVAHRLVGLDEPIAHGLGPGLGVEFDQRLEFAHGMGVAVGVGDAGQPAIGLEMVLTPPWELLPRLKSRPLALG